METLLPEIRLTRASTDFLLLSPVQRVKNHQKKIKYQQHLQDATKTVL